MVLTMAAGSAALPWGGRAASVAMGREQPKAGCNRPLSTAPARPLLQKSPNCVHMALAAMAADVGGPDGGCGQSVVRRRQRREDVEEEVQG